MKTLYFEGAGWPDADSSKATDVGNCRIRTAFTNDKGQKIYLEISQAPAFNNKGKRIDGEYRMYISHIFYITGDRDDENKNRIPRDWDEIRTHDYTKENIVAWVNKNLNCSFYTMEVLDWMEGYNVHADNRGYNLMDNHIVNRERTKARNEAYNMIDQEYREHCNEKYSVITLKAMDNNTITVYCHSREYNRYLQRNALKDNKPRTAIVNIWTKEVTYK